ncbi:MAG: hypothetical protein PQ612_06495 [Rickettsiales bacterium]|nr:hypothetical protein [Pseudomonadota bacterium]MDA0966622.1 hypothetical protein [Pseudomonadota bacterium]MDG4543650.1 hypothetical protein [Rickettsiales bacterium]MDG4545797.1 hypothetical protein [Rickettsiales bacterium]MDG4547429.1 hypothetical protein [Rickettsiales bacterium]
MFDILTQEHLNNQVAIQPLITVDKIPDAKTGMCQLTFNVPWNIAEQVANIAAPALASIAKSVEIRTDWERRRDNNAIKMRLRYNRLQKGFNVSLWEALRQIHKSGFSYNQFKDFLDAAMIQKEPDYYHGSENYRTFITPKELKQKYNRIRLFSMILMRAKGLSLPQIGKHYGIAKTTVSTILNKGKNYE